MSNLNSLYSNLRKLVRSKLDENKMFVDMLSVMEAMPSLEAETDRLHAERDQALETTSLAVKELSEVREFNASEMAKLDSQLTDKQAEHKDAMDQVDVDLEKHRREYLDKMDAMEEAQAVTKSELDLALHQTRDKMNEEVGELIKNVQALKEQRADEEDKLKQAEEGWKAFMTKHSG